MPDKSSLVIASSIVEAGALMSLDDLCHSCQVDVSWIEELTEHAVLEPLGKSQSEWLFSTVSVVRVAKAKRLRHDLGLNAAGIALVLDLLAQIDNLSGQLMVLHGATTTEID